MGASLAKAAFAQFPDLPDHAMRALVYMALTAKDTDETPHFWEGRDALAGAIGRAVVDLGGESTDGAGNIVEATYRAVERAVALLTVAKAITMTRRPAPGRNAEYRLNLSIERPTSDDGRTPPTPDRPRRASGATPDAPRGASNGTGAPSSMEHPTSRGSNTRHPVVRTPDTTRGPEDLSRKKEDEDLARPYAAHGPTTPATPNDTSGTDISDDSPTPTPTPARPPLRIVAGNPSPPVVTAAARQPALWPAAVPNHQEDTVNAADARALAREALKGRPNRPITRAGRDREAAKRGVVPASLIGADAGRSPQPPAKIFTGLGFCVPCHDEGRITLATDPVSGSTCDKHTAVAVAS